MSFSSDDLHALNAPLPKSVGWWFIQIMVWMLLAGVFACWGSDTLGAAENPVATRFSLEDASEHLVRWELKPYEEALRKVWRNGGDAGARGEAGVALAHELWRVHHKAAEARKLLAEAQTLGTRPALPLLELAELETFAGNYRSACDAARTALSVATRTQEKRLARTRFGQAVCEELFSHTLRGSSTRTNADEGNRVREAFALLDTLVREEPGRREPSRSQILLALLLDDGAGALRALSSYDFSLACLSQPTDQVSEDGDAVLARLLPMFAGDADRGTRAEVVRALGGARLFPEAAVLALRWDLRAEKGVKELVDYARWTDRLSGLFAEEYRRHALGKDYSVHFGIPSVLQYIGEPGIEKILNAEAKDLWKERQGAPPGKFRRDAFWNDLRRSFGACTFAPGDCDNFTFGHTVRELEMPVEQYGRKQVMKLRLLDGLVCNGYGKWLGGAGVGGWAVPPNEFVILHSDWLLTVWETLTDPEESSEVRRRAVELAAEDDTRGKTNPFGFFPGLKQRMLLKATDRLIRQLKEQGVKEPEMRTAFLRELQRRFDASFVAHEGRHVLDHREKPTGLSAAELEFRAKCSEMIFAPDPLLTAGLSRTFSPEIGRPNAAHGTASERVMKGLVGWLQAHAQELPAIDTARPLLPQFDRLTNEQIREAYRSMDPWAAEDSGTHRY